MTDLYLGTISGTSMDGLDLALISVDGPIRFHHHDTIAIPSDLSTTLTELAQAVGDPLDRVADADAWFGEFCADAILRFLSDTGTAPANIRAIGSHGQTIRHRPERARPFTVQIGDPYRIAERTGITTVADFRRRDIAAGGEGAPLVPPFHAALFPVDDADRAVVNIGGIGNVTLLRNNCAPEGFDTGPGNALMDAWVAEHKHEPYDANGQWAATGSVVPELLAHLLRDPYLQRPPPKSTGKEVYNLAYLHRALAHLDRPPNTADVQATLAEFTAQTICDAVRTFLPDVGELVICGGGRHNADLLARLRRNGDKAAITTTDEWGFDGDAVEAAAFAWLAARTLAHLSGNEPAVTGARGYRILGSIIPA